MVEFDFGPLLQGQMRTAKVKVPLPQLLLILQVWGVTPSDKMSWAGILVICLLLTLDSSFTVKPGKLNFKIYLQLPYYC